MFFLHQLEERVILAPMHFSGGAEEMVTSELYDRVEGKNTGVLVVVRILTIDDMTQGEVQQGSGHAIYTVSYTALVWQPFRGEVVDAQVTLVSNTGFMTEVASVDIFVGRAVSVTVHLGSRRCERPMC
jgi:DNA-directed RNA polymerase II subunit RPB7